MKRFATTILICILCISCLSSLSVAAATTEPAVGDTSSEYLGHTPLAPAGWNTSATAEALYSDAREEPVQETAEKLQNVSSTPLAPDGWNNSTLAKTLYGEGEPEELVVYASIIVTVHSPCDQEWRNRYPSTWMYEANRAIEEADALMYEKFTIDLQSKKQTAWTGNTYSGDGSELLDEAWDNQGTSGCSLMIAFTGKSFPYGGWGYVGGNGCLVIDQGYPANASVARHEVGHNYGCHDQYTMSNPPVCFMNDCYTQFNDICSTCYNTWYGNRYTK